MLIAKLIAFSRVFIALSSIVLTTSGTTQSDIVGHRDFEFGHGEVTSAPTEEKPESKLWWNDGLWWGVLWDPNSQMFAIHLFDLNGHQWTNVGPPVDERPRSSADVLWDGQKLYIASHAKLTHKLEHGEESTRVYRYSYNSILKSYSLDPSFPAIINNSKSRALVLAKDSTGQLWATWIQGDSVMINQTTGDDLTWRTPLVLPNQGSGVDAKDISSIVSFGGDKIGVFWGNQLDKKYYFAVHLDSKPDADWEPREVVLGDGSARIADDHINLAHSPNGNVIAVIKTGLVGAESPRILLMKRGGTDGVWSSHIVGLGQDDHTRPIVLIDADTDSLYVFARVKSQNAIYMKSSHVDNPTFSAGFGVPFISSIADSTVNNPTSTKQCVSSETGLLVLASDEKTRFYLHDYLALEDVTVAVEEENNYARFSELRQNHPNPFNPTTTIRYTLSETSDVKLTIFNLMGQQVKILLDDIQPAGTYLIQWDGRHNDGNPVTSGVYFYKLRAGSFSQIRKMTLLR